MSSKNKEKSPDYKSGYGQCKSDMIRFINEALEQVHNAIDKAHVWIDEPEKLLNKKKELKLRAEEIRRIRSYLKSIT